VKFLDINNRKMVTDMPDPKVLYEQRKTRVMKAINLEQPDRVPIAPKMGNFYAHGYNVSMYDMMMDMRNCREAIRSYLTEYQPDMVLPPSTYSINTMEILDVADMGWPGPTRNMPLDQMPQVVDKCYINDDKELDEFIQDPTHFTLTKIYPRKFRSLAGLAKLYLRDPVDKSAFASMKAFASPEVKEALLTAIKAGEAQIAFDNTCAETFKIIEEMGFFRRKNITQLAPFDAYAEGMRGLVQAVMDTRNRPEKLARALEILTDIAVEQARRQALAKKPDFLYMPLHAGTDEFMSPASYAKFYWPGVRRMIEAMAELGVITILFCEGKYYSRLEQLAEAPRGKAAFAFEKTDMKQAKKILGKVGCIFGNVSTTNLAYGTPEQVADETKRLIDDCADGGGFIMDCSIVIDNVRHENLRAMYDTTLKYGRY